MAKKNSKVNNTQKEMKNELVSKIKSLSTEISEELKLHEQILIMLPVEYRKQIKAFQKRINKTSKKIDGYKSQEKIAELESYISDIEEKLHKLLETSPIKNKEFSTCNKNIRISVASIFIKMRAKMAMTRLKRKILLEELNNLNLLFIFGIISLAQRDTFYQKNPHIQNLRFEEKNTTSKKIAFALLRMRSSFLSERLTYETEDTDPFKEKFVDCFIKINQDNKTGLFAEDEDKVNRIRAFAQNLMKKNNISQVADHR